jgi:UDP-2-acetamido-2,6-beta-L-arabino-hexul-4-ose reductase
MRTGCAAGQDGADMTNLLITGGRGFIGRNLAVHLDERKDCEYRIFDQENSMLELQTWVNEADVIYHLAGVNRPTDLKDYETGNAQLTEDICRFVRESGRSPKIVFSSSIQAQLDNPYGASKARAEDALRSLAAASSVRVRVYRLKNLFGKWCRPNYNSVTATFCHNIARDLPISVSDPQYMVQLSYIDDVVSAFLEEITTEQGGIDAGADIPVHSIALGELAGRIQAYHDMCNTLTLPDFGHWFNRALYATYLSYVPQAERQHQLMIRADNRGSLAEFVKQKSFGQIFVSRTNPGITRGNHYHHTKTEKFLVVEGEGLIRMRSIEGGSIEDIRVTGSAYQVVDIPPGKTHAITNVGTSEMITIFWASEIFDPNRPDTYFLPVDFEEKDSARR